MNTVGERLSFALELRQMKAIDLAKGIGVTKSTISQICSGKTKKISAETAMKICNFMNINPFWLILGKGKPEIGENAEMSPEAKIVAELVDDMPKPKQQLDQEILISLSKNLSE